MMMMRIATIVAFMFFLLSSPNYWSNDLLPSCQAFSIFPSCPENDNYCDCETDEPLTSACSSLQIGKRSFHCHEKRFFPQLLYPSRISDGVCDCCDCSDETGNLQHLVAEEDITSYGTHRCQALGQIVMQEVQAAKELRQRGLEAKKIMADEARRRLKEIRTAGESAEPIVAGLNKSITQKKHRLNIEEKKEEQEFSDAIAVADSDFRDYFNAMKREEMERVVAAITLLLQDAGVEAILVECDDKYELPGDEPDDVKAFELASRYYTHSVSASADLEVGVDGEVQPSSSVGESGDHPTLGIIDLMVQALSLSRLSTTSLMDITQLSVARLTEHRLPPRHILKICHLADDEPEDIPISPVTVRAEGHVRPEAEALRNELAELQQERQRVHLDAKEAAAIKGIDFGPGEALFALWNRTFSFHHGEYNYVIKAFGVAKQAETVLGRYQKVHSTPLGGNDYVMRDDGVVVPGDGGKETLYLVYSNGEPCHAVKKYRTFLLQLVCSETEEEFSEIEEPEKCFYQSKVWFLLFPFFWLLPSPPFPRSTTSANDDSNPQISPSPSHVTLPISILYITRRSRRVDLSGKPACR